MNPNERFLSDITAKQSRPVAQLGARQPVPVPPEPESKKLRHTLYIIGGLLALAVIFYAVRAYAVRQIALDSAQAISEHVAQAKDALVAFDIDGARTAFIDIKDVLADVKSELNSYGLSQVAEVVSLVYPKLAAGTAALDTMDRLSDAVLAIINTSQTLKEQAFSYLVKGQGTKLIGELQRLRTQVNDLGVVLEQMKANAAALDYPVGNDLLAFRAELHKSEKLLSAAIRWLSEVNHVAILFVNPSEIRPGGGFPGSYAAVTVDHGNLSQILVQDIYDPDGQLDLKVVPPKQLQAITGTWGARDANWFFDFPTSARKTLYFLNNSKIYTDQSLSFDALLAINVNAVSDLLKVTGPITLDEYALTLDSENFLDEVQREVRSGLDRTTGEPKRILKVLTPILFEKLSNLSAAQKKELVGYLRIRFAAKDMLAYIEDPLMQAYLEQLSIAGEVNQSKESDLNEYLAVVNANIGGGKSDAVMTQAVTLTSQIDLEGKINNVLTVKRTHGGKTASAEWYGATNKNYLQVFTPRGSVVTGAKGAEGGPAAAHRNYDGYQTDGDLVSIENSTEVVRNLSLTETIAFNKTVFATWLNIGRGSAKTLELQYTNPQKLSQRAFADYTLIYEKQPGVETAFSFSIDAPPEYKWQESNNSKFTYTAPQVPGKLQIDLTLIPIR